MLNQLPEIYKLIGGEELERLGNIDTILYIGGIATVVSIIGVIIISGFAHNITNNKIIKNILLILYFFGLVLIISFIGIALMSVITLNDKLNINLPTGYLQIIIRFFAVPLVLIIVLILANIPRSVDPAKYIDFMKYYLYQDEFDSNFAMKICLFLIPVFLGVGYFADSDNQYLYYLLITGICSILFLFVMQLFKIAVPKNAQITQLTNNSTFAQSIVMFIVILTILSNITQRSEGIILSSILQIFLVLGSFANILKLSTSKGSIIALICVGIFVMVALLIVSIKYSTDINVTNSILNREETMQQQKDIYTINKIQLIELYDDAYISSATADSTATATNSEPVSNMYTSENDPSGVINNITNITIDMKTSADDAVLMSKKYLEKKLALLNAISIGNYIIKKLDDYIINNTENEDLQTLIATRGSIQTLLTNMNSDTTELQNITPDTVPLKNMNSDTDIFTFEIDRITVYNAWTRTRKLATIYIAEVAATARQTATAAVTEAAAATAKTAAAASDAVAVAATARQTATTAAELAAAELAEDALITTTIAAKEAAKVEATATTAEAAAEIAEEAATTAKDAAKEEHDISQAMLITAKGRVKQSAELTANIGLDEIKSEQYFMMNIDIFSFSLSTMIFSGIYKFLI